MVNRKDFRPSNDSYSLSDKDRKTIKNNVPVDTNKILATKKLKILYGNDLQIRFGKERKDKTMSVKFKKPDYEDWSSYSYLTDIRIGDKNKNNPYHSKDEQVNAYNENAEQEQTENNKKYTGLPKSSEINSVSLGDDGSLDTVVYVNGKEIRYSTEEGSQYRNRRGEITDKGWRALKKRAIEDYKNDLDSE